MMPGMSLRDAIREMVRYVREQPACDKRRAWCLRCEAFEDAWADVQAFRNGLMNAAVELLRLSQWPHGPHEIPEPIVTAASVVDGEQPGTRRWRSATRAVWATL